MKNLKKIIASVVVVAGFSAYVWYAKSQDAKIVNRTSEATNTPAAAVAVHTRTVARAAATVAGGLKDGNYTGSSVDAFYGFIKVKATISDGKLTNVEFLSHPDDQHNSREINDAAMPILKQEAIKVQSAQVDTVSGATDTSKAFAESLETALSQARS